MTRSRRPTSAVAGVLAGALSYDALAEKEQAIVCRAWIYRMAALRAELDYASRFTNAGESYSEIDEKGNLVIYPPAPDTAR